MINLSIGQSVFLALVAVSPLIAAAVGFAALLFPFRKLCEKAGFPRRWAGFAAALLASGEVIRFALLMWPWATGPLERLELVRTFGPWISTAFVIECFGLLWLFAYARWPGQSATVRGANA
jgi:hypothetical protein